MATQEELERDKTVAVRPLVVHSLPLDDTVPTACRGPAGQDATSTETMDAVEQQARALAAKLSLPHTGFVLSRPRLRARVEALRTGGLVCLVAGPGYGKTTFMVDLLSHAEGRTAYLALDEGDCDPLRFLGYLAAALRLSLPEELLTPQLDWSPGSGADLAVVDLASRVVECIRAETGTKTLLAIDDLHLVDSSAQVREALEFIVRGAPPGWTILVSSRRRPLLRLDGVMLSGRLIEFGPRELRLTPREVAAWAVQSWGLQLQPAETRALWRATQGWPAALALLGHRLLGGTSNRGLSRVAGEDFSKLLLRDDSLDKYLEEGVLSGLTPAACEILLAASLLPRVVFPRDAAFFGEAKREAESTLEEFAVQGCLVSRLAPRSYAVHPLVRGLAERRARSSNCSRSLLRRAAEHLEAVGALERSVTCYLEAGCFTEAARVLRLLALSSPNPAYSWARPEWVALIPHLVSDGADPARTAWPWLLMAKARVLQERGDYAQAGLLYEEAARLLAAAGDKEGLLSALLGSAACLFNQGRWEESLAVMGRCRSLVRSPAERAEVLVVEGGILVALCRWDEAVENWERALLIAPSELKAVLAPRVHHHRARLFYLLGHYQAAKTWADKALAEASSRRPGSVAHALFLNGAAIVAGLSGDYRRAERLAGDCERMVQARGYGLLEAACLLTQAVLAAGRGDPRGALAAMKRAADLAGKTGDIETGFWAEDMMGDFCRRHKNAERALSHHRKALEMAENGRLALLEKVKAQAGLGMDLAVLGKETEARPLLEEAIRLSRRWGLLNPLAPALFYLGWLEARALREQEAAKALAECLQIASDHEHIHFFTQEARVATPILALCERLRAGAFVRERVVPLLPEPLRAYFIALAQGKTYPTEVELGPPRRNQTARSAALSGSKDAPDDTVIAAIESLTERERLVLEMLASGLPNKVIGAKLFITEKTVKTHTNHIFRKLKVGNRLQAALVFQRFQRASGGSASGRPGPGLTGPGAACTR